MIREFFLKRRFRKLFKNILSPKISDKLVDQIVSGSTPDIRKLKEATINFVCVSVRGDTSEIISERMALATDLAAQYQGVIFDQISGIIIIAYGIFASQTEDDQNRIKLCEELQIQFTDNVKIVYGKAQGHVGNLGSAARLSFSFIVPGFLNALSALAVLPYGEICEYTEK